MSLGYRTDLALLRLGGTQVEDRGDYLVVRSPHNPTHWWGNFLLLAGVPAASASASWLDRFGAAFTGAEHVALGFDGTDGDVTDLGWFAGHGFNAEAQTVMTASAVHEPVHPNRRAVYRRLHSQEDWAQSVELRMRCNERTLEPTAYRAYVTAKAQTNRRLVKAGHGGWFGAFVEDRLVTQLGLLCAGPGRARFQAVESDLVGIAEVGSITWPATYRHFAGEQYVRDNLSMGGLHQSLAEHLALLVAEGQGRVIGVVVIGAHRGGPTMWRLYVLPEMHGRGVGTPVHEVSTSSGCVWCCRGRTDTRADSQLDRERARSVG